MHSQSPVFKSLLVLVLFNLSLASPITLTHKLVDRQDGACPCDPGFCCSQFGFCGIGEEYCGSPANTTSSNPLPPPSNINTTSPDPEPEPFNSASPPDFNNTARSLYSNSEVSAQSVELAEREAQPLPQPQEGACPCALGLCCSPFGFCGTGPDYCGSSAPTAILQNPPSDPTAAAGSAPTSLLVIPIEASPTSLVIVPLAAAPTVAP